MLPWPLARSSAGYPPRHRRSPVQLLVRQRLADGRPRLLHAASLHRGYRQAVVARPVIRPLRHRADILGLRLLGPSRDEQVAREVVALARRMTRVERKREPGFAQPRLRLAREGEQVAQAQARVRRGGFRRTAAWPASSASSCRPRGSRTMAMRMETGRPNSRHAVTGYGRETSTPAARRSSLRERSTSPMICLNPRMAASTRACLV